MLSCSCSFRRKTSSRLQDLVSRWIPFSRLPRLAGVCALLLASALILAADGAPTRLQTLNSYGQLPLSFESNHGQSDSQVKFLARGAGYTLFLTPDEAVFSLQQNRAAQGVPSSAKSSSPKLAESVLGESVLSESVLNHARLAQQNTSVFRVQLVNADRT